MYYYDAAHVLDAWEGSGLLCQDNAATNSLVALEQYADRAGSLPFKKKDHLAPIP